MAFKLPGWGKAIQPSGPTPPPAPKYRTNKSFGLGKQGLGFSRGVAWVMLGGSSVALLIGFMGRMDETIQIRGVIESSEGTEKVVSTLTKKIGTVFVKNGEFVSLKVKSPQCAVTFEDLLVRQDPNAKLEVHIDTDEGNACDLDHATSIELKRQEPCKCHDHH